MAQQSYSGQGRVIAGVWRSHTLRHTTLGRTPLEEGSTGRRDLYLTTHHSHMRHNPFPWRDSNPQFQQLSGRRLTPLNARLPGMALIKAGTSTPPFAWRYWGIKGRILSQGNSCPGLNVKPGISRITGTYSVHKSDHRVKSHTWYNVYYENIQRLLKKFFCFGHV